MKQKKTSNPKRNFIVNGTPTPLSLNIFSVDNNAVLPKDEVSFTTASQVVSRDLNAGKEGKKNTEADGNASKSNVPLNEDLLKSLMELTPDSYGQTVNKLTQKNVSGAVGLTEEVLEEFEGHNRKRSRRMDVKNSKILTFMMAESLTKDTSIETSQRGSNIARPSS